MITSESEYRVLRGLLRSKHRVSIKEARNAIKTANNKLIETRCNSNDVKIDNMLRNIEITRCKELLKDIT